MCCTGGVRYCAVAVVTKGGGGAVGGSGPPKPEGGGSTVVRSAAAVYTGVVCMGGGISEALDIDAYCRRSQTRSSGTGDSLSYKAAARSSAGVVV